MLVLFATWLLLSGHFTPLLITFGLISSFLVVVISLRMDVIDQEGHPIHLSWRALFYWPWLIWRILLANLDVVRRILSPSLPISPCVIILQAGQKSELGKVIYANSITLTPGTVTMDLDHGQMIIHALSREAATDLAGGAMDRMVTKMEGLD
jgi:multicomponent Na+:H+ antiporter subunit E